MLFLGCLNVLIQNCDKLELYLLEKVVFQFEISCICFEIYEKYQCESN